MSTKGKLSLIRYIDTEVEEQMTEKSTEWHIEDQCRLFLKWRRVYGIFFGEKETQRMCDALGLRLSSLVSRKDFLPPIQSERDAGSAINKLWSILRCVSYKYKSSQTFRVMGADFPLSESKHIRSDGDCWNFQIEWVKIEKYNGVDECHFRVRFHPLMENEYLPWVNFRKTSEELWRVDWNALRENRP
jgi:hypothetical protein